MINLNNTLFRAAATAAILAGLAGTAAYAITDTAFNYSTPRPGFITIHPMAMYVDGDASATNYFVSWNGATLTGNGCFMTSVYLPAGARITGIRTYSVGELFVNFTKNNLATDSSASVFAGTVGDTTGNRKATFNAIPASEPIVNNQTAYGLGVCVDGFTDGDPYTESFQGARIEYTAANAGD